MMIHKIILITAMAAVCSATPVAYDVNVTCKEFPPNMFTGPLTVMLDASVGTLSAGTQASDNCYFSLAGSVAAAARVNGKYDLTSPADVVCWHTGGFCVYGPQLVTLVIDPIAGGQQFTIVSASITTVFTLPAAPVDAPEPGGRWLLGIACGGFMLWKKLSKG